MSQAAYLAYEVSRPVTGTASRGASLFRKKAAAEAKRRIKKVETGKKLAKKIGKKAASDTAKKVAGDTTKTAAKETAKNTAKETAKTTAKAATTAQVQRLHREQVQQSAWRQAMPQVYLLRRRM